MGKPGCQVLGKATTGIMQEAFFSHVFWVFRLLVSRVWLHY